MSSEKITIEFQNEYLEFEITDDFPFAIIELDNFIEWINEIKDKKTKARIMKDLNKSRRGLFGNWKRIDDIYEMRLDYGPGYRVYYGIFGNTIIILLNGGDKGSQKSDILQAKEIWKELKNEIRKV